MSNAFFRTAGQIAAAMKVCMLCLVLDGPGLDMPETPQHDTRSDRLVRSSQTARGHDARPVVIVYSDSSRCPACRKFEQWSETNRDRLEVRFSKRKTPDWVEKIPAFHYRTSDGWRVRYGFSEANIDRISREIER